MDNKYGFVSDTDSENRGLKMTSARTKTHKVTQCIFSGAKGVKIPVIFFD